jgi:short-chain Z-isoprenyl diphosphate synthase
VGQAVGADAAHGPGGAANISPLLEWCEEVGVEVVTLWLLSTDNLNRLAAELAELLTIIEEAVDDLASEGRWRLNPVGALDLLPAETARRLKEAADRTRDVDGIIVNVAVGYGGRREIADAVRSLLQEHASKGTTLDELAGILDVEHISEHLCTRAARPDLVIRTSGAAARRLPSGGRAQRVLLREAYWPTSAGRPPRAAGLRRQGAPLRGLNRPPAGWQSLTSRSGVSLPKTVRPSYLRINGEWGSSPFGRPVRESSRPSTIRRSALGLSGLLPVHIRQLRTGAWCVRRCETNRGCNKSTLDGTAQREAVTDPRSTRPRHQRAARRPGAREVRGARGGPPVVVITEPEASATTSVTCERVVLDELRCCTAGRRAGAVESADDPRARTTDPASLPPGFRLGDNDPDPRGSRNLANEGRLVTLVQGPPMRIKASSVGLTGVPREFAAESG